MKLPPEVVSTIVNAVASRGSAATLTDIIEAFADRPERRTAQRWTTTLVEAGVLAVDTTVMPHRYTTLLPAPEAMSKSVSNGVSNPEGGVSNSHVQPRSGAVSNPAAAASSAAPATALGHAPDGVSRSVSNAAPADVQVAATAVSNPPVAAPDPTAQSALGHAAASTVGRAIGPAVRGILAAAFAVGVGTWSWNTWRGSNPARLSSHPQGQTVEGERGGQAEPARPGVMPEQRSRPETRDERPETAAQRDRQTEPTRPGGRVPTQADMARPGGRGSSQPEPTRPGGRVPTKADMARPGSWSRDESRGGVPLADPARPSSHPQGQSAGDGRRAAAANAPSPRAGAESRRDRRAALPAFPANIGAYTLAGDAWTPLPRNGGRVIPLPIGAMPPAHASARTSREPLATAVFTGSDLPPVVHGAAFVIAYIGDVPVPPTRQSFERLRGYPVIEVMALQTTDGGGREAIMVRIAAGIAGFAERRVPATLDQPLPGITVWRATGAVPSGRYAVACGERMFEVEVGQATE